MAFNKPALPWDADAISTTSRLSDAGDTAQRGMLNLVMNDAPPAGPSNKQNGRYVVPRRKQVNIPAGNDAPSTRASAAPMPGAAPSVRSVNGFTFSTPRSRTGAAAADTASYRDQVARALTAQIPAARSAGRTPQRAEPEAAAQEPADDDAGAADDEAAEDGDGAEEGDDQDADDADAPAAEDEAQADEEEEEEADIFDEGGADDLIEKYITPEEEQRVKEFYLGQLMLMKSRGVKLTRDDYSMSDDISTLRMEFNLRTSAEDAEGWVEDLMNNVKLVNAFIKIANSKFGPFLNDNKLDERLEAKLEKERPTMHQMYSRYSRRSSENPMHRFAKSMMLFYGQEFMKSSLGGMLLKSKRPQPYGAPAYGANPYGGGPPVPPAAYGPGPGAYGPFQRSPDYADYAQQPRGPPSSRGQAPPPRDVRRTPSTTSQDQSQASRGMGVPKSPFPGVYPPGTAPAWRAGQARAATPREAAANAALARNGQAPPALPRPAARRARAAPQPQDIPPQFRPMYAEMPIDESLFR